jgi:hypothetical protein
MQLFRVATCSHTNIIPPFKHVDNGSIVKYATVATHTICSSFSSVLSLRRLHGVTSRKIISVLFSLPFDTIWLRYNSGVKWAINKSNETVGKLRFYGWGSENGSDEQRYSRLTQSSGGMGHHRLKSFNGISNVRRYVPKHLRHPVNVCSGLENFCGSDIL